LVWFLHSDSPFSRQKKIALSLSKGIEQGVATFYDLPDIPALGQPVSERDLLRKKHPELYPEEIDFMLSPRNDGECPF
jgi:hypothetical protein